MKRIAAKWATIICAAALAVAAVAGLAACSPGASSLNSEQQANRSYMSQVNEIMAQLEGELDSFVDAVSRGDIVNMRTQADNAYRLLDKLSSLEAPEELSDVQKDYVDGTNKLRGALDSYIKLYSDVEAGSFDQSTYSTRIKEIQSQYNEGVDTLKKGDEAAASKQ